RLDTAGDHDTAAAVVHGGNRHAADHSEQTATVDCGAAYCPAGQGFVDAARIDSCDERHAAREHATTAAVVEDSGNRHAPEHTEDPAAVDGGTGRCPTRKHLFHATGIDSRARLNPA